MIDCRGTNPARTDTHCLSPDKVTSGVRKTNQPHKPLQASREGRGRWARDCLWTQQSCEANSDYTNTLLFTNNSFINECCKFISLLLEFSRMCVLVFNV